MLQYGPLLRHHTRGIPFLVSQIRISTGVNEDLRNRCFRLSTNVRYVASIARALAFNVDSKAKKLKTNEFRIEGVWIRTSRSFSSYYSFIHMLDGQMKWKRVSKG